MNTTARGPVAGIAAALDIANLDTDQIMPKQFLRGIDKAGLDRGLLWDLRFDGDGRPRPDFVLNRPATSTRCGACSSTASRPWWPRASARSSTRTR